MEIPTTIDLYDGLSGSCKRGAHNPSSPFVNSDKNYEGNCMMMPQVGCRFRCGSLDTNVVAKIVEHTEDVVKFETLSGSLYIFTIVSKGTIRETINLSDFQSQRNIDAIAESVKEYK